jgi:hypothetical protein
MIDARIIMDFGILTLNYNSSRNRQASGFYVWGRQRKTQGNNWNIANSYGPIENYKGVIFGSFGSVTANTNEVLRDIHQLSY